MGSKKFIFFEFRLLAQPILGTSTCRPCSGIAHTSGYKQHTVTTLGYPGFNWKFARKAGVCAFGAADHVSWGMAEKWQTRNRSASSLARPHPWVPQIRVPSFTPVRSPGRKQWPFSHKKGQKKARFFLILLTFVTIAQPNMDTSTCYPAA